MRSTTLLALFALMSSPAIAQHWQVDWDWALSASQGQLKSSVFIEPNHNSHSQLDGLLDVQMGYGQWSGLFALYSQSIYQNSPQSWFEHTDNQFIVRELAWQGSITIGEQSFDATLGKIRLDYGVSYGYRPLDMFKPYRQNPIGLSVEEGSTVAALSQFDANGEWSVLYTNSHWSDNVVDHFDIANQQQGIGIRRYGLINQHEYQLIGYYDDVRQGAIGASWVSILGPAWEFHAEALWQHKSQQYTQPEQSITPVKLKQAGEAWQGLAGFTYTTLNGHSFIGEYWFDSRAWSKKQWQQAQHSAQRLQQSILSQSLASSYAQGLNHYNLTQHNLMLHWNWDTDSWLQWQSNDDWHWLSDFTPKLDLLISPQDGGIIATQWLTYQWIDTGEASIDLEFTARFLSGKSDSAYAQINDRRTLLFMIKGKF
ncbi:hypothetical protein H2O73_04965 [Vibrio sp. 404]|uniref:Beta-lactamase n=1 Tax=Vibrio marinisediminis TaxID=2758441 RepID=A0A7W2IT63_9VIBR|nr:hypothetical protein [Vibrio marinisediminis]MBA5761692.1 hypothetical protein [Vibrio marinisediminis]